MIIRSAMLVLTQVQIRIVTVNMTLSYKLISTKMTIYVFHFALISAK